MYIGNNTGSIEKINDIPNSSGIGVILKGKNFKKNGDNWETSDIFCAVNVWKSDLIGEIRANIGSTIDAVC